MVPVVDGASQRQRRRSSGAHVRAHAPASAVDEISVPAFEAPDIVMSALIVSDLHIVGPDTADHIGDSLVSTVGTDERLRNPLEKLVAAVKTRQLGADLVICCGDLTNRAGIDGFKFGWDYLEGVANELNAKLIFTPGNHDLDVMDRHGRADPAHIIKSITRNDDLRVDKVTPHTLFEDGFEVYRPCDDILIVNVDSNGPSPSTTKGRIGDVPLTRIDALKSCIERMGNRPAYAILLCHHHPFRHGDIDRTDYSALNNAPELLNAIREATPDMQWLVLHGHKHHPRIGRVDAFTILAAGSCSASLDGHHGSIARNQFYLVDILRDPSLPPDHPLVGRIRSWDWFGVRWRDGQVGFGIPDETGFGAVVEVFSLAKQIADYVREQPVSGRTSQEVLKAFPVVQYLIPNDEIQLREILLNRHNVEILVRKGENRWRHLLLRT